MNPSKKTESTHRPFVAAWALLLLLLASECGGEASAFSLGGGAGSSGRSAPFSPPPTALASTSSAPPSSSPTPPTTTATAATSSSSSSTTTTTSPSNAVSNLKRALSREYATFFDPMIESWYAPDVSFDDPLTSLAGVGSYRGNVDMLAGRTALGRAMFDGARIDLHSVTGGEVSSEATGGGIADVVTRWTLRVTVRVLPWRPEAVFSGVSIYELRPGGEGGVLVAAQRDYWDSINIASDASSDPGAQYRRVGKGAALKDFLGQLKPDGLRAAAAAPELPYMLLRRGDGYEVRRYPPYVGIETEYDRRDYGYAGLGAFAAGMDPLAPSVMRVYDDVDAEKPREKTMTWPLRFAIPGEGAPPPPEGALEKAGNGQWKGVSVVSRPERVVAVRTFEDAAVGPAVRNADRELRGMLKRDGLASRVDGEDGGGFVEFSQYDAVHSMGRRRTEVWIELGGHPF